jgi:hypothetical protein
VLSELLEVAESSIGQAINETQPLLERQVCTLDVLADLFAVSRGCIGDAVRKIQPLLGQDGYTTTPATKRFRTAPDLLAFLPPTDHDTHRATKRPC